MQKSVDNRNDLIVIGNIIGVTDSTSTELYIFWYALTVRSNR